MIFFQDLSGSVFGGENTCRVDGAPEQDICVFQEFVDRLYEGGHAIDRKHPHGCPACQFFIFAGNDGVESRPQAFEPPSVHAAFDKVFRRILYFHCLLLIGEITG